MKIRKGWKWLIFPIVAGLLVATFLLVGCSSTTATPTPTPTTNDTDAFTIT